MRTQIMNKLIRLLYRMVRPVRKIILPRLKHKVTRSEYGIVFQSNWQDKTFEFYIFAAYKYFYADYLQSLSKPFIFLDIGANQGLYAILASQNLHCNLVYAFEPVPKTIQYLLQNIALNHCSDKVTLVDKAVASESGYLDIHINDKHSGAASLKSLKGQFYSQQIKAINFSDLNQLIAEDSTQIIVKIDVEGSELTVIEQLFKTHFANRITSIFYECREIRADPSGIQPLLESHNFSYFQKIGSKNRQKKSGAYDVLATKVNETIS